MFTQQQEQTIIELYNANFSARYIARKLRVNRQAVAGFISALEDEETDPEILDAANNHGQGEYSEGEILDNFAGI